jgi:hypothetical protein
MDLAFDDICIWLVLGLYRGRGPFFKFNPLVAEIFFLSNFEAKIGALVALYVWTLGLKGFFDIMISYLAGMSPYISLKIKKRHYEHHMIEAHKYLITWISDDIFLKIVGSAVIILGG